MLEQIVIERFKSLKRVDLKLGALNLLIGTNASGKSNFLDALRVLQGLGNGFTVSEVFDGKPRSATSIAWDGIRGGSAEAVLRLPAPKIGRPIFPANICRLVVGFRIQNQRYDYEVSLNPTGGFVREESLHVDTRPIFITEKKATQSKPTITARVYLDRAGQPRQRDFEKHRSLLHQLLRQNDLPDERREMLENCIQALSNQQRLDLVPAQLRQYSQSQRASRLGERGEDFASLVKTLISDKKTRAEYVSWLRELTPTEVDEVVIKKGAVGELLFALREGKREFPAKVLSDGTLRFAAIAAALFQPDMPDLLLLEEVENGIHPTRLRLLMELLRSRTGSAGPQFLATTHSPIIIAWLLPSEYATTFFCVRDGEGPSTIRPVADIPEFQSIVQRTPFSDLFAEGWLEATA